MNRFVEDELVKLDDPGTILNLVRSCDREHLNQALNDTTTLCIIRQCKEYEDKVCQGFLEKVAVFWMSFIDHARLLFMLLFSVKVNNLPLFHRCKEEMDNLFFAYVAQNYARCIIQNVKVLFACYLSRCATFSLISCSTIY